MKYILYQNHSKKNCSLQMKLNQEILVGDNSLSAEMIDNPYGIRTDNIIFRPQPAVSDNSSILDSLHDYDVG